MRGLPRLWMLVLVVILGVMAVIGWQYLRSQETLRRSEAEQALTSVAVLKLNEIAEWRATRLSDAELLAMNPTLLRSVRVWAKSDSLPPEIREYLNDAIRTRMRMFRDARKFHDIRLVDGENRTIVGLRAHGNEVEDAESVEILARARAEGKPELGHIHDHDGQIVIDVVAPLFVDDADPELAHAGYALVIQLDPSTYLYPLLQRWPLPSASGETLIARRDRDDVLFLSPLRHRESPPLTFRLPLSTTGLAAAAGLRGELGLVGGRDYRGVPVLAATFRVEGTDWILVSKVDENEALAAQRRETMLGLGILLAAGVAVTALVMAIAEEATTQDRLAIAEARAEIATRDAWLGAIFRAAPIGIGITRERRLVEASAGLCQMVGYSREALIGVSSRLFYETDAEFIRVGEEVHAQLVEQGAAAVEAEWRRADGDRLVVLLNAALVVAGQFDGETTFTITDITERKLQETMLAQRTRELERSNKELATFAYVASHDLRSPLRGISQLAEWITEDMPDQMPEEIAGHLKLMRSRVARMERLLDDLLAYSRVGRLEGDVAEVDVARMCREVFDLIAPPEGFGLDLAPDLPCFTTRATPLAQVFQNLIGNAVKHHDRDTGTISVSARAIAGGYVFTVADDGPGISPQFHDRIFALFQTLRPRDEVEGSGMGLALVRKLVEIYGGRVAVASDGVRGTAFTFTWPDDASMKGLSHDRHVA